MNALEQYDARISRIMAKIEAMRDKEFQICVGTWPPQWKPPLTEEEAAAFEAEKGIRLPEDYRQLPALEASPSMALSRLFRKTARWITPSPTQWTISSISFI